MQVSPGSRPSLAEGDLIVAGDKRTFAGRQYAHGLISGLPSYSRTQER